MHCISIFVSGTVEELYPEAAVTSKLLKSGRSLTSLYTDYANAQQELLEQRQENEQLKEYLENVLQVCNAFDS